MIPNYNSGLLQQQQQQQLLHQNQQQGQQQPQQQTLQQQQQQDQHLNPSNMEQPRLHWGQMQPFRQQNPSADLNHQKTTQAHLAEFMKRTQQQQSSSPFVRSQPQAHQGFPMGLGMPQQNNGAPVLGGNPQQQQQQQQPFHDQHPQQAHLPQGFTNMGVVPNGSVAASMPARNPPAVLQNPQAARQLEMINMAQQSQNALNKFPQPQQQQQQQHSPPQQQQLNQMRDQQQQQAQQQQAQFQQGLNQSDMFASPVMSAEGLRRPSPHPINNPSMQQNPGVGPGAQPPSQGAGSRGPVMTMNELQSRVNAIRTGIQALGTVYDSLAQQMSTIRGNPAAESQLNQKMKETQAEIAKRKDYMNRMVMMWRQQNLGGGNGGQPANPWMHHPNLGQPFDPSNGQTPRQQMGLLPGQPSHLMQTSPNLPHVQAQNPVANSGMVNPRPGQAAPQPPPAPSQSLPHHAGVASPFTNGMGGANAQFPKPNMQPQQLSQAQHPQPPQQPQQLQNGPGSGPSQQQTMSGVQGGNPLAGPSAPPLALDKAQFERYLTVYCSKRGIKIDPRVLGMENRPLDLHALHIQVLQEGGFAKVEGNDNLWCIIGGRLGFVQFPGTATEPAKAGPGVAQSLQHIYKEFIAPFEVWYLGHVQDFRKQQYVHMYSTLQSQLASIGSPYTLQQIAQLSILSVADLRSQGFDDKIIQIIENGKPMLQRIVQEQRSFADGVRSNNASQNMGQGMDQNGATGARQLGMGPTPPFGGSAAQQQQQQQQQNALNRQHQAALQQQMLHQQSQQQAGHHLQSQLPEGVDNILGVTRMPQQQPGPMQAQGQMAGSALQNAQKQQVARAVMLIEQFKNEFIISNVANANFDVPIEQQVEYSQILEQVYHKSNDMERKVAPLALLSKDENIVRRAVNIMCTINQQKVNMSSASGPRYIVNLEALRAMANDLNRIHEIFMTFQTIKMQHQQQQLQKQQQQQHLQQSQMMNNMMAPPIINKPDLPQSQIRPVMPQNRPPSVVPPAQPQLSSQQQVPPNLNQTLRPPPTVQPTSKRKGPQTPGSVAVSSPSPSHVASAPTPVANTPTPTATASSPPAATKSPKAKAPPKKATAPKTRRTSKVVTPVVPPAAPEPAQTSTASPPTTSGGKRPREEEEPTPNNNNGGNTNPAESSEVATESSPPKRIKTEWEAQPTEAQRKKQENIANLKTDEEVIDLMGQMTELIKFAAGAEEQGQSVSLTTGISETLEMLLKGYGPIPDSIEGYGGTSVCGEPSGSRELETGPGPLADAFDEFIDFSYVTAEDEDSKTPDLISSSSTNPSPESNHEAEAGHHLLTSSTSALDIKVEDSSDLLRLGTWKEIDGGESAYYQTTEWKYDSPMTSLDQPWAIFNP